MPITASQVDGFTTGSISSASQTYGASNAQATKTSSEYNVNPVTSGPLAPQFAFDDPKVNFKVKSGIRGAKELADGLKAALATFVFRNSNGSPMFYGYGTGKPMTATVTEKLAGDRLDMTAMMNVSGHDFRHSVESGSMTKAKAMELVKDRAKNNSYNIAVRYPNGNSEIMRGIVAKGALFTVQDISIKLQPGKNVIEMWPDGSAGVGGYIEGRRLEIDYAPR
jgi:hypothetical protein